MLTTAILLLLSGGLPYYLLLEKKETFDSKKIFFFSSALLLVAIFLTLFVTNEHAKTFVFISLISAIFSIYRASKTTNLYKFGYHLIFINAPFFMLFEETGALYSFSLLLSLIGVYFLASFYEKHYGSANYYYITGTILSTPFVGTFLSVFLVAIALYPPFPNSIFFLSHLFNSEPSALWYAVVIILFFGNFYLAMNVMRKTVFGKPNENIHYVDLTPRERAKFFILLVVLLLFSVYGFKELLL